MNLKSMWMLMGALVLTLPTYAQERKITLQEAVSLANENNKNLKAERLQWKSSIEETKISKSAMMPSVSASGSYSYYFDRQVIFMPGAFTGNEAEPVVDVAVGGKNTISSTLSIQQPILAEASRRKIQGAKINESMRAVYLKDLEASVVEQVTTSYYTALLLQEKVSLNKQSLSRNLKSLEDSRLLLVQGKSLKVDTLRNFIVVENLRTTINYLENQHQVVMLELQQLLGIEGNETLVLTDSLKQDNSTRYFSAVEPILSEAIPNRPDIQLQKMHIEWSTNLLSQNRALRLPSVSLVGAYQIQAQADTRNFDTYRWPKTSFIGLHAYVPIFSGNSVNAKIRQSNLRLQSETLKLQDATEKANTEIMTLRNNLKEVLQRVSTQEKTIEAAEINFRIINDRYKNGLSSRLELSDAELGLTEAKMNYLNTVFQLKIVKLQLDKAMGLL